MLDNGKKYDVIYADPPWTYQHCASNSRRITNQYPTMSLQEIKNLAVPVADDCVLYLWATAPKVEEALSVLAAWGFVYRSQMVWDKQKIGMGYWFRGQHEVLLVGVRGKISPPHQSTRSSSVYREPRGKHSAKPIAIRDMIMKWFPTATRLELFAREKADGWDAWGNEVE